MEATKSEFRKERFVYYFIIAVLFNLFISTASNGMTCSISVIASVILLIGLAKWLEFPWVVTHLEVWLERAGRAWDFKFGSSDSEKQER